MGATEEQKKKWLGKIAEGSPDEIQMNKEVAEAYLGTEYAAERQ